MASRCEFLTRTMHAVQDPSTFTRSCAFESTCIRCSPLLIQSHTWFLSHGKGSPRRCANVLSSFSSIPPVPNLQWYIKSRAYCPASTPSSAHSETPSATPRVLTLSATKCASSPLLLPFRGIVIEDELRLRAGLKGKSVGHLVRSLGTSLLFRSTLLQVTFTVLRGCCAVWSNECGNLKISSSVFVIPLSSTTSTSTPPSGVPSSSAPPAFFGGVVRVLTTPLDERIVAPVRLLFRRLNLKGLLPLLKALTRPLREEVER
mmetsp:Transcript_25662/g.31123  ORF Transcript_25662/g.31123 Transcript_25662/m.31123 type:complete len:260 (-) Transcript_25662:538-1317(-)